MRPGDIALAVNSQAWYAYLICLFTRSRYSHVRLIVDESGRCVEAVAGGVRYGTVMPGDVVIPAPLTDSQRETIRDWADQYIGIPYAWLDVVLLGLAQVGVRLPWLARRRVERPDRLFCSQLIDLAWSDAGYDAFRDGRLPRNVSPGDLADLALRWGSIHYTTDQHTSTGAM